MNECQDKQESAWGQAIEKLYKMVGWKVGEGGPLQGQWKVSNTVNRRQINENRKYAAL
jgi:hypothetical protein